MSVRVDLSANGRELKDAHDAVLGDSSTNWLIYSYEKQTNSLKVQGTGDGGLEELVDELDESKVQYAYVKVTDPNTKLDKYVFIGMCGEGAPDVYKNYYLSHLNDVTNYLQPFSVQIAARNDSDVSPSLILKRVAQSTGANYSHHDQQQRQTMSSTPSRPTPTAAASTKSYQKEVIPDITTMRREAAQKEERPAPVKTNYEPIKTSPQPLGSRWNNDSETVDAGASAVRAERERVEREAREREELRAQERQVPQSKPERPAPVGTQYEPIKTNPRRLVNRWNEVVNQSDTDSSVAAIRAERERAEKETHQREKQLSHQNAPVIYEQTPPAVNVDQDNERRRIEEEERRRREAEQKQQEAAAEASRQREEEETRRRQQEAERERERERERAEGQRQRDAEQERQQQEAKQREEEQDRQRQAEEQERERQRVLEQERREQEQREQEQRQEEERRQQEERERAAASATAASAAASAQASAPAPSVDRGVCAIVQFGYDAGEDNEMSIYENETIVNIDQVDEGWWIGESEDGKRRGLFPANYVDVIQKESVSAAPPPPPPAPASSLPTAVCLYDYTAGEENEISFNEGDAIRDIHFASDDWWSGTAPNGTVGLFPANHVELQK